MPRREIQPAHDTYTDIMEARKMRKPLEATYNDEDSGVPEDPTKDYIKIDNVGVEGVDPETLLISEIAEEEVAENVAEKLYKAKEAERTNRAVRRAEEAVAGWSPKKKRTSHAERVQENVQERKGEPVIGEDLIKIEAVNAEKMPEKKRLDLIRDYTFGREKYLRNRQKDKEKTQHLGQRQKINDVLKARVEAGGEQGAAENVASERMKDYFDVHRDSLSDGSATLSNEELLRHGRFTALDFFDIADDIKDAPNFSTLVKVAGKELRARLQRDSDLAEHFLHMVKRNEAVREVIPHFEELERTALESIKNPLTPQEREQLEKRYGLVIKEKNELAENKGWNEEELSHKAFFDHVEARTHEAYKYEPEKKRAKKYSVQHRPKPTTESRPNP